MIDWNDLRLFAAVAREGSFRKAAQATGLNHATLSRRIRALEEELGTSLVERSSSGLELTEAGRDLRESCEALRREVDALQRRLAGRDQRLEGRVSITYPDGFSSHVNEAVAALGESYPEISIAHVHTEDLVDLERREADIAVRAAYAPPEQLLGRRIGEIRWAVYGAASKYPHALDELVIEDHDWIGFGGRWRDAPPSRWLRGAVEAGRIRAEVDTPHSVRELTASGLGLGVLMAVDGDRDPRLTYLAQWPGPALPPSLWLLVHPQVSRAQRVRKVADHLYERLRGIEGAFVRPE